MKWPQNQWRQPQDNNELKSEDHHKNKDNLKCEYNLKYTKPSQIYQTKRTKPNLQN